MIFWLAAAPGWAIGYRGFLQPMVKSYTSKDGIVPFKFDALRLEITSSYGYDISWLVRNDIYLDNLTEERLTARHEIREAYVDYYTPAGDFRVGEQIISWGMADENNPTDNINPEDFSDPFVEKSERKLGVLALKSDIYLGNWLLEGVWVPYFKASVLPDLSGDYSFMPFPPGTPLPSTTEPPQDPSSSQFGLRAVKRGQGFDWSLSYYSGYEKIFTPVMSGPLVTKLIYNRIRIAGADFASDFFGLDTRGETAYFITEDEDGSDPEIKNPYFQYVLESSYTFENDFKLGLAHAGETTVMIDDQTEAEQEKLIFPRAGMQLCMFSTNAWLLILEKEFPDQYISIRSPVIHDAANDGMLVRPEASWSPQDNLTYYIGLVLFSGSGDSMLGSFSDMDQAYFKIRYSF